MGHQFGAYKGSKGDLSPITEIRPPVMSNEEFLVEDNHKFQLGRGGDLCVKG